MAKDTKKPEEEKATPQQPATEKIKKTLINWENIQNLAIIGAMVLGLRQPPKPGEPTKIGEKQVPNWILSAFPSFTDEDEVEYNLGLSSHSNMATIIAMEEFEANLIKEGVYDEVIYRVRLVKVRREFLERVRNPAPENKNATLTFSPLELSDAMTRFMNRILEEKNNGGTPEEIFERQKKIALNRKLLEKKSALKKIAGWVKTHKAETIVGIFLVPIGIIEILIWLLS